MDPNPDPENKKLKQDKYPKICFNTSLTKQLYLFTYQSLNKKAHPECIQHVTVHTQSL